MPLTPEQKQRYKQGNVEYSPRFYLPFLGIFCRLLKVRRNLGLNIRHQEFRRQRVFGYQFLVLDFQRTFELTQVTRDSDSFFFYRDGLN